MTLNVESPRVYTRHGVPISVTGIAQVSKQEGVLVCCGPQDFDRRGMGALGGADFWRKQHVHGIREETAKMWISEVGGTV